MIDVLYLMYGRQEFTDASWKALHETLNVRMRICLAGSADGPVACMNRYLASPGTEIFAKIDNDTIVPPGWLEAALGVMERNPQLDLLGIEPPKSRTPSPSGGKVPRPELHGPWEDYAPCFAIGGIGLMRRSAFAGREPMVPHSIYGGFTDWQWRHPEVRKGWIVPPLKVFLLDRLPIEPWASLSKKYIAAGVQRPWTNYDPSAHELWDWWTEKAA